MTFDAQNNNIIMCNGQNEPSKHIRLSFIYSTSVQRHIKSSACSVVASQGLFFQWDQLNAYTEHELLLYDVTLKGLFPDFSIIFQCHQ